MLTSLQKPVLAVSHNAAGQVVNIDVVEQPAEPEFEVPFNLTNLRKHLASVTLHRRVLPEDTAARRVLQAARIVGDAASGSGEQDPGELSEQAQQAKAFAEDLARLGRWLSAFSPASLVSLDYGSVADRIQPDESPQDMADAVELLRAEDPGAATAALRRIFQRWAPLAHIQAAN